jgi:tRNA modification GTPase
MAALHLAHTPTALRLLAGQRITGLRRWAWQMRAMLAEPAPDNATGAPTWPAVARMQWLLERSATLRRMLQPARVGIIGAPNAGKSTLANALLGRPLSIAGATPGTTRDWVDALCVFTAKTPAGGDSAENVLVPVVLVDTAGVRVTADPIEAESIARTHAQAAAADVVIAVVDATAPLETDRLRALDAATEHLVVAINKVDMTEAAAGGARSQMLPPGRPVVHISALQHTHLDQLMEAVLGVLELADVEPDAPMVFTHRQDLLLRQAMTADRTGMRQALTELLGEAE